jgi:hypothetical protein
MLSAQGAVFCPERESLIEAVFGYVENIGQGVGRVFFG